MNPAKRKKRAVNFYTDLFRADSCDVDAAAKILQGLPQLSLKDQDTLKTDITF